MKNLIRATIVVFWFLFQEDRFEKFEWFVHSGYHMIDAFYIVYNGMY